MIPFSEIVGNAVIIVPEQTGAACVKAGNTFGFTVMVIVIPKAHCPASGVNAYVAVAVLSKAGDQVPVIPLSEVVGSAAKVPPEQIGAT
ncbi:hypothetical protein HYN49_04765 [Flavobacterium pallidum]|uniref:Uncharacterized protein n=1 Tax=Flavobacterium pallidum TaxID=2172098 RepID=A0A2S1SFW3_9FLAO|nr:hypothetical protein HYN49_04765 [Flavobacterium pallidum]